MCTLKESYTVDYTCSKNLISLVKEVVMLYYMSCALLKNLQLCGLKFETKNEPTHSPVLQQLVVQTFVAQNYASQFIILQLVNWSGHIAYHLMDIYRWLPQTSLPLAMVLYWGGEAINNASSDIMQKLIEQIT